MSILSAIRSAVRDIVRAPRQIRMNAKFFNEHKYLASQRKILYALTPPPHLSNVGDQAQVVAIQIWLKKHFPNLPVIEVDKDQSRILIPSLQRLIQPGDVIFLHSGGNLGDRGIWSESVRRLLIQSFPNNQIVSLPQTIYFSDTPAGIKEKKKTRQIYATHPNLTIIGRDPYSGDLAAQLFPKANTFCMPDFVLSLPPRRAVMPECPPKVLLCLRLDDESAITAEERDEIGKQLPYKSSYFDTTLSTPIKAGERNQVLERTLDLFFAADVIVTDRYHGLIFTVLCRKPCIVLPTVDHKLTSAMHWFEDVPYIAFAKTLDDVPRMVEAALLIESRKTPDFSTEYFDKIPALVGLDGV